MELADVLTPDVYKKVMKAGNSDKAIIKAAKIKTSLGVMEFASVLFLLFPTINWVLMWGKYFVYFYGVLDLGGIITTVTGALGGVSTSASTVAGAQGALAGFANLTAVFTDLMAKFTPALPAGLMVGTILNSIVSFWPMVYYRAKYEITFAYAGAFFTTAEAFFWTFWFGGWIPPIAMLFDGFNIMPGFGTGSLNAWNSILVFGTLAEWGATMILLTFFWKPFNDWFLFYRIKGAKKTLRKYDSVAIERQIRKDYKKNPALRPKKTKKAGGKKKKTKSDGFESEWASDFFKYTGF